MKNLVTFSLFENSSIKTFYKFVPSESIVSIIKNGLEPRGNCNGISGSWAIEDKHLSNWCNYNKWFGSPLQALLFFPSKRQQSAYLIEFTTSNEVYRRNVDLLFQSQTKYRSSFTNSETEFGVTESFVTGFINSSDIEIVSKLGVVPTNLSKSKADGKSLLKWVFTKSNIEYTDKINVTSLILNMLIYKIKGLFGF